MKKLFYIAAAAGLIWAAPAYSAPERANTSDAAREAVRDALAERATAPTGTSPDQTLNPGGHSAAEGRDQRHRGADQTTTLEAGRMSHERTTKNADASSADQATHDATKMAHERAMDAAHADQATHEATKMAHERAMTHAAADANASHVDAANRAAQHWAGGSREQATTEAHDAAGQMRTRIEHGDTRGMEGEGGFEGGFEGGGMEGGFTLPGSGTTAPTTSGTSGGMTGSTTTRTGK